MRILLFLLLFPVLVFAQKTTMTGTVTDSAGVGLPTASIVLMEQRDSIIAQFATSSKDGAFTLKRLDKGDYLLQINYAGYESHYQTVTVEQGRPLIELGKVALWPSNVVLGGVDITADRVPIRISNDTVTYNAAAYKVLPGSTVEDLLKKLPYIDVAKDGTVKAHGKTVKSVMVDGKEFFGDDPKIATKNLPAEAVDKVQVFDKKSEQAEFTGIDDGNDERTINLQLKDGAKKGQFGKITGGYGTKNRYEGKFNLNKFSGKTQISALGGVNNINEQGFSFQDYLQAMGGFSALFSGDGGGEGGGISLGGGDGIPGMGPSQSDGLGSVQSGGLNANHDFSKRTRLSTNYFYNRNTRALDQRSFRENLLGDAAFNSLEQNDQFNRSTGHRLNLTLKSKLDSFQQITFRTRWNLGDTYAREQSLGSTTGTDGTLQNENDRFYRNNGQTWLGDGSLTYKRKLNRRGRTAVADANFQAGNQHQDAQLLAQNRFYGDSLLLVPARQRQDYADDATNWGGGLTLTEGLGRKQFLELRVSAKQYANATNKLFYDTLSQPLPQEVYNSSLSTLFRRGYSYQRASASYSLNRQRHMLRLTGAFQQAHLDGELADRGLPPIQRNFKRFLPSASYQFEPKVGVFLRTDYRTRLREPSLAQLMPVVDNSNPLRISTGNPDLQPEYTHSLSANYNHFDMFSNTSFYVFANVDYTLDKITNTATVDELFRTITQPINVRNDWMTMGSAEFSRPLRPLKSAIELVWNGQYSRSLLFINNLENVTQRNMHTVGVSFNNLRKKYWDGRIGVEQTFNRVAYSKSTQLNQQFGNQRYYAEADVTPTSKWALSTGFDLMVYPAESFGADTRVPLWRASLSRYVLKGRKGQIKLSAFDLLNQNRGISRNTAFNYTEEVRTRNLARYFMLTFAYSVSGFGDSGFTVDIKG